MERRTSARLALALAAALAIALQARFVLGQVRAGGRPEEDPVRDWLAAVARLPPLPENATVGFVTTLDPANWEARLFLTRYALAPRMVLHQGAAPWVIGHFGSAAEAESVARLRGLLVLAGPGDGLFLLGSPPP